MYYALGKGCYIRKIGNFGYIKSSGLFNDLAFDKSGQVFLSALTRTPKTLEQLSNEIASSFIDVSSADILPDVKEFFDNLADDGYVV